MSPPPLLLLVCLQGSSPSGVSSSINVLASLKKRGATDERIFVPRRKDFDLTCESDVIRLYMSDKNLFYDRYVKWPESKKAWAVTAITARYAAVQPAMA